MRGLVPNKFELWPSIALVIVGIVAFRMNAPLRPTDTIGFVVVVLFSWVMGLNAALDMKRMSWPVRAMAILWLMFVTYVAFQTLPPELTFDRRWADR